MIIFAISVRKMQSKVGKAQLETQSATSTIAEVAMRTKVFKICCGLIALHFQNFFQLIAQFYKLNLILFHFDRNIDQCRPFFLATCLLFSVKIAKNAVFALCCEISITKVGLRFNLVRKCRSAIAELRCPSTESKSSSRKFRCASAIKKINLRILRCAFTG